MTRPPRATFSAATSATRPSRSIASPSRALAGASEGEAIERLGRMALVAAKKVALTGRVTAYVCERGQCSLPAIAPEKLASQIRPVRPYR